MRKLLYLFLCLIFAGITRSSAQSVTCNAQYTWAPAQSQTSPLGVGFTNLSTVTNTAPSNSYTLMTLYFGDGSSNIIPAGYYTHNYAAVGTYSTMLVVRNFDTFTNATLCADTAYQQITISYNPCILGITTQNNGTGSYTFTATSLTGNLAPGLSYAWSFGDNATGTGSPATHTYANNGTYMATLNVTGVGCTGVASTTINYYDSSVNCSSLSADFMTTVTGATVLFNNYSSYIQPTVSNIADWYFGDGTSQLYTGDVYHTYLASGTYNVTLVNRWIDSVSGQVYCMDSVMHPVTVTNANYISGNIYLDSLNPGSGFDSFKVWLIKHDSVANTLTAVDSQFTGLNYQFNDEPAGDYLVKAAMVAQTAGTTGYVPTYHLSSVYWGGATVIHHLGGTTMGKHIDMQTGTVTSGPGFIGGNISLGAGKGTATGIPGMLVYLRNANNVIITSSITNADGDYSFSNIPTGTYSVYPEAINYNTTPYNTIQVTSGQTHVSAIDFEQKNDLIYPKSATPTGIATVTKEDGLNVYPNPSKNFVIIESINNRFSKVQVVNTLGQVIKVANLKTGVNKLELSGMNAGIYYLLISGPENARSMKIIKQ